MFTIYESETNRMNAHDMVTLTFVNRSVFLLFTTPNPRAYGTCEGNRLIQPLNTLLCSHCSNPLILCSPKCPKEPAFIAIHFKMNSTEMQIVFFFFNFCNRIMCNYLMISNNFGCKLKRKFSSTFSIRKPIMAKIWLNTSQSAIPFYYVLHKFGFQLEACDT